MISNYKKVLILAFIPLNFIIIQTSEKQTDTIKPTSEFTAITRIWQSTLSSERYQQEQMKKLQETIAADEKAKLKAKLSELTNEFNDARYLCLQAQSIDTTGTKAPMQSITLCEIAVEAAARRLDTAIALRDLR